MRTFDVRIPAAAAAIVVLLLLAMVALARTARLHEGTRSGADPASALNVVPPAEAATDVTLTWMPDPRDTGRAMEPATRTAIGDDLVRGWAQLAYAIDTAETAGLDTYLTGPALQGVLPGISHGGATPPRLAQVSLGLRLYAADGQTVALEEVTIVDRLHVVDGLQLPERRREVHDVVLVLRDGTWRVHHRILRSTDPVPSRTAEIDGP